MYIGMLTDYVSVEFCNGPALASQSFRRNMEGRGHQVSLVGPRPVAREAEGDALLFNSLRFRQYATTALAMPWPRRNFTDCPPYDVIHAHSNSLSMHWALMMRHMHGIPCLQSNTIHLPAFAHHAVPDALLNNRISGRFFEFLTRYVENRFCNIYSQSDGLVVQCQGLVDYWRNIGLDVPLHIIPRPIDLRVFDRPLGEDPFNPAFRRGGRLLVACRHAAEKSLDQLLRIFARHVLPRRADASLTLIGDGPVHNSLKKLARRLGINHRVDFVGEKPHRDVPVWYANADVFSYPSTSETFGQVTSEALWMGLPVVGFDDGMGVAYQVKNEQNGLLVQTGPGCDERFGEALLRVINNPRMRMRFSENARRMQRELVHPEVVYKQYEDAYAMAAENIKANPPALRAKSNLGRRWSMFKDHVWPWAWKHMVLSAMGSIPANYKPKTEIPFDAAPDEVVQQLTTQELAPAGPSLRVIAGGDGLVARDFPLPESPRRLHAR